jgi:hypothetical protein
VQQVRKHRLVEFQPLPQPLDIGRTERTYRRRADRIELRDVGLSFLANRCRKMQRSRIRACQQGRANGPVTCRSCRYRDGPHAQPEVDAAAVTSAVVQRETFVRSDYCLQLLEPPHPFLNAVQTRERLARRTFASSGAAGVASRTGRRMASATCAEA